jgi:hypothetical protein
MSDAELIARLRLYGSKFHHEFGHNDDAADRIEALTEQLAAAEDEIEMQEQEACMMENDYIKLEKERDALEAKLAQAVEALENLADCVDLGCFCSEMQMASAMDIARTTLAVIKGGNDAKSDL